MRIKSIWFREYAPPPGSVSRTQNIDLAKHGSLSAKEGALGIVVTCKEHIRLYPWSMISFVDYTEDK